MTANHPSTEHQNTLTLSQKAVTKINKIICCLGTCSVRSGTHLHSEISNMWPGPLLPLYIHIYLRCIYVQLRCTTVYTCYQNANQMTLVWPLQFEFHFPSHVHLSVRNCDHYLKEKITVFHSTQVCREDCGVYLVTRHMYGLHNCIWTVLKRQINWIIVCLGVYLCFT